MSGEAKAEVKGSTQNTFYRPTIEILQGVETELLSGKLSGNKFFAGEIPAWKPKSEKVVWECLPGGDTWCMRLKELSLDELAAQSKGVIAPVVTGFSMIDAKTYGKQ